MYVEKWVYLCDLGRFRESHPAHTEDMASTLRVSQNQSHMLWGKLYRFRY